MTLGMHFLDEKGFNIANMFSLSEKALHIVSSFANKISANKLKSEPSVIVLLGNFVNYCIE